MTTAQAHIHVWKVEPPTCGDVSPARCDCGATRTFQNFVDIKAPDPLRSMNWLAGNAQES